MKGDMLWRKELREFVDGTRSLWSARLVALAARRGLQCRGLDVSRWIQRLARSLPAADSDVAQLGIMGLEAPAALHALRQLETRAWLLEHALQKHEDEDGLAKRKPGKAAERALRLRGLREFISPADATFTSVCREAVRLGVDLDEAPW